MLYGERERERALEAKERRRLPPLFSFANTLSPTFFLKKKEEVKGGEREVRVLVHEKFWQRETRTD